MKHSLLWARADRWDWIVHCMLGLCALVAVGITFAAIGRVATIADHAAELRVHGQHFVLQLAPVKTSLGDLDKAQLTNDGSHVPATNRTSQAQAPSSSDKALIGG